MDRDQQRLVLDFNLQMQAVFIKEIVCDSMALYSMFTHKETHIGGDYL